jgi:hypothetical protein
VDGNFLVRSVVDADDFEGGVFEDGFVVRGQGCGVPLGDAENAEGENQEHQRESSVHLHTVRGLSLITGNIGVDGARPGIDAAGQGLGMGEPLVP